MKRRLLILISLFIAVFCPHVHAQIVNFNMEEENSVFSASAIDSITFETNENNSFVQILWYNGKPYYNTINDNDFLDFEFEEVVINVFEAPEYGFKNVITTNYGQFGVIIEDSISNNGHFAFIGDTTHLEDLIVVHIDTNNLVRHVFLDSIYYEYFYSEQGVTVIALDNGFDTVSYNSIGYESFTDYRDGVHATSWFKLSSFIESTLSMMTSPVAGGLSLFLTNNNNPIISDIGYSVGLVAGIAALAAGASGAAILIPSLAIGTAVCHFWERIPQAIYYGNAYIETLNAVVDDNYSATLGFVIHNGVDAISPFNGPNQLLKGTMKLKEKYNDYSMQEQSRYFSIFGTDTVRFVFNNLIPAKTYLYQPIVVRCYSEWVNVSKVGMNDLVLSTLLNSAEVLYECKVKLYGEEKSFYSGEPSAQIIEITNIEEKSAVVKCKFHGVASGMVCGVNVTREGYDRNFPASPINGEEQDVSISGLTPATEYTCRAYVHWGDSTSISMFKSFITAPPDISGTWTCTETYYSSSGEISHTSYEITLYEDGTVDCPTYPVITEGLPPGTYSVGNNGSVGISILQFSYYTYYWQDSGVNWEGHIDDLDNPTTITGCRYNWNYNYVGYFEGDHVEMIMTR